MASSKNPNSYSTEIQELARMLTRHSRHLPFHYPLNTRKSPDSFRAEFYAYRAALRYQVRYQKPPLREQTRAEKSPDLETPEYTNWSRFRDQLHVLEDMELRLSPTNSILNPETNDLLFPSQIITERPTTLTITFKYTPSSKSADELSFLDTLTDYNKPDPGLDPNYAKKLGIDSAPKADPSDPNTKFVGKPQTDPLSLFYRPYYDSGTLPTDHPAYYYLSHNDKFSAKHMQPFVSGGWHDSWAEDGQDFIDEQARQAEISYLEGLKK